MAGSTYFLGTLAQPVLNYLDAQALALPELRAKIQACSAQERIPIEHWWQWLETIQQECFRPGLGVYIGRHTQPHHVGLCGYLMLSCNNLQEALAVFQRFEPLIHNLNPSIITLHGDRVRVSWDDSYGSSTQLSNEFLVSAMAITISNFVNDPTVRPVKVSFSGLAPECSDQYAEIMGCTVEFGAERMSFDWPASYLTLELPSRDPHLCKLLMAQAETLMETIPRPDPFVKELRDLLANMLGHADVSAESVAEKLDMPIRSFYRRLDQRGLTFRDIVRTIRYPLAKQYLADGRLGLIEVALRLGYSDQSAFGRAFKSWHGTTPSQYRRLSNNIDKNSANKG